MDTLEIERDSKIEEMGTKKLDNVQGEILQITIAPRNGRGQKGAQDTAGDITRKIKIEVPDFEGKVDLIVFSDWINSMEECFNWYDMAIYSVEDVFQVAFNVEEYINNQNSKKIGFQTKKVAARKNYDARRAMQSQATTTFNKQNPNAGKGKVNATHNKGNKGATYVKCGEDGHISYQCPRNNNLCMEEVQDEEEHHEEETKENPFDYGVYMADDLVDDEEKNTSFLSVVRCIFVAPKVEEEDW
ncbi:hypothetical protein SLEP1_g40964 [Rubroshorea leprosula]|uniref:CCHC-type domain-containing protein n=1 Tax=Rubroshorea leprosula TaxID=152421 RepID=A0AAV5L511_9ROSI|nr:hypothetical protein SLEP1_g40964 [Rubroshorea leprosula]